MKKIMIDGKPIVFKSTKNTPPLKIIREAYAKIPDDKSIPVVFQTKTQYLNEYIKNQEKKKNIDFSPAQERAYKKRELVDMKNIVSRYTTNHNPYIDRRTVFFTDNKMSKAQFKDSVNHEYGHELWEQKPCIKKAWKQVPTHTSPTRYGRTEPQEDFAESFMLHKKGMLKDPVRNRIINDSTSKARRNLMGLSEFDVNGDGKINDYDMDILRRREKQRPSKDKFGKNSVGEALGIDIPYEAEFGNQFKIWGGPKEYDPRIQDNAPLARNIIGHVTSYKNRMLLSGMPMLNAIMPTSKTPIRPDLFSRGQELLPGPREQKVVGYDLVIASPEEVGRDIANMGKKIYGAVQSLPDVTPSERVSELKSTLGLEYTKGNESFFAKAERKERERLDALDEQRSNNLRLQQLLALRSQGLLNPGEQRVIQSIQRTNILENASPQMISGLAEGSAPEETSMRTSKRKKPRILQGGDTYLQNVPGLWRV